jgi:hypothetical protein
LLAHEIFGFCRHNKLLGLESHELKSKTIPEILHIHNCIHNLAHVTELKKRGGHVA